jgi:hypothetical protein
MESRAQPGGRRRTPAQRIFVPYVLVSLVALQGCTRDPAAQPSATAQSASALEKGSGKHSVSTAGEPEYVPGQILVRFRKAAADDKVASIHSQQQAQVLHTYRTISDLQLVQVPEESFRKALQAYNGDPSALCAEPNYIVRIAESSRATPDDPRFGELWGLHNTGQSSGTVDVDLNMPEAWDLTTGSDTAGVITVIDTGVDYNRGGRRQRHHLLHPHRGPAGGCAVHVDGAGDGCPGHPGCCLGRSQFQGGQCVAAGSSGRLQLRAWQRRRPATAGSGGGPEQPAPPQAVGALLSSASGKSPWVSGDPKGSFTGESLFTENSVLVLLLLSHVPHSRCAMACYSPSGFDELVVWVLSCTSLEIRLSRGLQRPCCGVS